MRKFISILTTLIVIVGFSLPSNAASVISSGDTYKYETLNFDLRPIWNSVNYSTYSGWDNLLQNGQEGQSAFGNRATYNTYWTQRTDLALIKEIDIEGTLDNILLSVCIDNGFAIFVNGNLAAKQQIEAFANDWRFNYNLSPTLFNVGKNEIAVLAEDHGYGTYFDMRMTADITPVAPTVPAPEPSSMILGITALTGFILRKKAAVKI